MPKMISKGRFNHRLHAVDPSLWQELFSLLAEFFKRNNSEQTYVVDSLPIAVCDQHSHPALPNLSTDRIRRSVPRLHLQQAALLLLWFAGASGGHGGGREPVEFSLVAGSEADVSVFKEMQLDLPEGSIILADKAYADFDYEEFLKEVGLDLKAQRKKNSKRPMPA